MRLRISRHALLPVLYCRVACLFSLLGLCCLVLALAGLCIPGACGMRYNQCMRYLIFALLLSGCATVHEDLRSVNNDTYFAAQDGVTLYKQQPYPAHTVIGPVEAFSCKYMGTDPAPSEGDADRRLKLKAHEMQANGVIDIAYTKGGPSLTKDCWSYIHATGTAIRH